MGQLQNPGSQVRISLPSKCGRPKPILTLQYHGPPSSRWSLVARVTGGGARGPGGLQAQPLAAGGERQQLPSWRESVILLWVPAEPSTHLRKRKRRKQQQQRLLQHYTLHAVCATTWLKDAQMLTQVCPMLGGGRWLCWACFEQEKGSVSRRVSSSPCTVSLLPPAWGHHPLPLHLLCQNHCLPLPLLLPSLSAGLASSTIGVAPTPLTGGKAESGSAEGQEEAGAGLKLGHHPHRPWTALRADPATLLCA